MCVCVKNGGVSKEKSASPTVDGRDGIIHLSTLCSVILAVGVDPEAERHVWVEHQVGNGTTRHVGVTIHSTATIHDGDSAVDEAEADALDGIG